ncbi:MAG: calcium/proton exchanger [Methanomassiliicoccales archaeon]|nr:MAG: calcium/proton exchanger [Methanomassiliicoccales archaeon]
MKASGDVEQPSTKRLPFSFIVCIVLVIISLPVALGYGGITTFIFSSITILPLAFVMGRATEELAAHLGPGAGGLLNATFGNATELIIAIFALSSGLVEIVKASITGSIIGNILLVLGLSMLVGGIRHKEQKFDSNAATTRSTMLVLAVIALIMPTLFLRYIDIPDVEAITDAMSIGIACILITAYILGLVFSLRTHKHFYNPAGEEGVAVWSKKKAILVLVLATIGVAIESHLLVGSIESSIQAIGISEIFIGVIVIAIVGNAAEHGSAILMAWKNKMNLSVSIATSSSTQIALFVAPVLVFVSHLFASPMTLAFEIFELVSIALAVVVLHMVSVDGKSNWYEGVLLIMVYTIIAIGFFFHP